VRTYEALEKQTNDSKLSKLVEVVTENLDAIDVVDAIKLLVLGVSAVVAAANREENDVLASGFLERESNRNRASLRICENQTMDTG
jgi:hypothetical protein